MIYKYLNMNNFLSSYELILKTLEKLAVNFEPFVQLRRPKLNNMSIIALALTAEYMSIDTECQLFRVLEGTYLFNLIERSVYNRRKRHLCGVLEEVRQRLVHFLTQEEDYFIIDSMPIDICKWNRANRCKICQDDYYCLPDIGYQASKKVYGFGYKLHVVCSSIGVIQCLDLTGQSVHDSKYLKDIKYELSDCLLIGDRGYISKDSKQELKEVSNIYLLTESRKNQNKPYHMPYYLKRMRKKIENIFSQFENQLMIIRNFAKTFTGFRNRILTKITAFTMIQYLNCFIFNRKIANIKVNIT